MLRPRSLVGYGITIAALALSGAGCQLILGIGNEEPIETGGSGGSGASGGSGGSGATGGSATGGAGGTGGTGGAAPTEPWQKVLLGAVYGGPVAIDAEGNVVLAVFYTEGVDFGDGDPVVPVGQGDIALLKYDKAGALVWKKVFPANGTQSVLSLAVGSAGEIAIGGDSYEEIDFGKGPLPAGAFAVKLDAEGTVLWSLSGQASMYQPTVNEVAIDSKGNVLIGGNGQSIDFGTGALSGGDFQSFYVAKLDGATGQPLWAKITKGGSAEGLVGLVVDSSDSLILTGWWEGPYLGLAAAGDTPPNDLYNSTMQDAIFLLRLDPDGNKSHGKMIAGQNPGFLGSVTGLGVDDFGWSILVGGFSGQIQFEQDQYDAGVFSGAFVVRDQTTSFDQWTHGYVQDGASVNFGEVAIDGGNDIAIIGSYDGAVDLGGGPLPAGPAQFVFKIGQDGAYRWSRACTFGDGGIQNVAAGSLEDETVIVGNFYGNADLGFGPVDAPQGFFVVRLPE